MNVFSCGADEKTDKEYCVLVIPRWDIQCYVGHGASDEHPVGSGISLYWYLSGFVANPGMLGRNHGHLSQSPGEPQLTANHCTQKTNMNDSS